MVRFALGGNLRGGVVLVCVKLDIHHHFPDGERETHRKLDRILANQETIMAAIDELNTAIDDLATELDKNNAEIEVLLTQIMSSGGASDQVIGAAVSRIRGLISANQVEVDKASAATTPPATPAAPAAKA